MHGDLNWDNILVDLRDTPWLIDFAFTDTGPPIQPGRFLMSMATVCSGGRSRGRAAGCRAPGWRAASHAPVTDGQHLAGVLGAVALGASKLALDEGALGAQVLEVWQRRFAVRVT